MWFWVRKNWNRSGNRCKILSSKETRKHHGKRGKVIILVAPSGGGKSTMTQHLLSDFGQLRFSVSATTRPPRKGEIDGLHYHFLSDEEFQERIDRGDFLEWEEFYNGTR